MYGRARFEDLDGHDAYELLGVPEDASAEEIQRAHRRQIRTWHPDSRQDDGERSAGDLRTTYINLAREILLDHRDRYDAYRRRDDDLGAGLEEVAPPPPPREPPPGASVVQTTQEPSRRRPGGLAGIIVALALTIAIPVVGVRMFLGGDSGEDTAAGPTVPARFAGTWTGSVDYAGAARNDHLRVRLQLTEGAERGEIEYPGEECGGQVTVLTAASDRLTLDERVDPPPTSRCADGRVDVTYVSGDRLHLEFVAAGELKPGAWAEVVREP